MSNAIASITRASTRTPGEPLNILTFPTHERYQSGLAKTNAMFYMVRAEGIKDWNAIYARLPLNHILLDPSKGDRQLPPEVDFDLVFSQNKFGQFQIAKKFARALHLPLVSLEHTLPMLQWSPEQLAQLKSMRGDINVFISEFSREKWGWNPEEADVIHHGIDTEEFSPNENLVDKKSQVLSVVNDWKNRDWCCGFKFWEAATKGHPTVMVGDTPGLSKPAKNTAELVYRYRESDVFVNTSLISPVPTALLEAMSCGCAVVSTATCMIPEVIESGRNGILCKDPAEMNEAIKVLLKDQQLRRHLGERARQTILDRFSLDQFVSRWNDIFQKASNVPFIG